MALSECEDGFEGWCGCSVGLFPSASCDGTGTYLELCNVVSSWAQGQLIVNPQTGLHQCKVIANALAKGTKEVSCGGSCINVGDYTIAPVINGIWWFIETWVQALPDMPY